MIRLSETWYYALNALLFIAKNKEKLVKIKDIASGEKISESLLRRIIAKLEWVGILKTIRGRNGWVALAKEEKNISFYDILEAVGEDLVIRGCVEWVYCSRKKDCHTSEALFSLQKGFNSLLKIYTIDKLTK
jgi:Rrf2 family transcriptional regulator, nitric oxide-sensitive transcriptional repressor